MRSHRLPSSNYTFTYVIKACADVSTSSISRSVYAQMRKGVESDSATLVGVLATCSQSGLLGLGKWADWYILDKGFDVDVVLDCLIGCLNDSVPRFEYRSKSESVGAEFLVLNGIISVC
ncbi:uncharacterized protein A4U43_C01F19990 [Asparagus officinalis]|uniref:Uncharacterized protein n=1 Tax=Asparagus officinalis TaxID=4686 RepID=A0A5P1FRC7_ASPOF|nr:uncharacterized protein A4U43_C01F19990 [Asparagus officinalis]